jgi:hypothetical protein
MSGTRLSYVVVPQEGTVKRPIQVFKKGGQGIVTKLVEEPAGYLVYFPRGHVIRVKNRAELRHFKLHKEPRIVNLEGLQDRNSPIGKLMFAQDEAARRGAMQNLEEQVIRLAEAKSGKVVLCRDSSELEDPEDDD